ncbi:MULTISPECIES: Pr6Pr family membrane protein [Comamonas]|jgi:hypothetical protein|uniref:Pr6Pr family membrane protein n=1 Tax=Comamonas TaxID=283 RepID=UPI0015F991BD|nr:Pr6Pr family membrane protein [Comamonas koreensis]
MHTLLRLARFGLAALVLAAIGQQLSLHAAHGLRFANFFSYFTVLSNLLAALVLVLGACTPARAERPWLSQLRFFSALNMAIVGLVFALLLRNLDVGLMQAWINRVLHYLMPVAVVLDWLLAPPAAPLARKVLGKALVLPALYLLYTLLRGQLTGWYPYPFLNPAHVGGFGGVAAYAATIALGFVVLGSGLLVAAQGMTASKRMR